MNMLSILWFDKWGMIEPLLLVSDLRFQAADYQHHEYREGCGEVRDAPLLLQQPHRAGLEADLDKDPGTVEPSSSGLFAFERSLKALHIASHSPMHPYTDAVSTMQGDTPSWWGAVGVKVKGSCSGTPQHLAS